MGAFFIDDLSRRVCTHIDSVPLLSLRTGLSDIFYPLFIKTTKEKKRKEKKREKRRKEKK